MTHKPTQEPKEFKKVTKEYRAEIYNNYVFVRNLSEKGGVIDALLLTKKATDKVIAVLLDAENKTFSQVWGKLIGIKGARFEHQSN